MEILGKATPISRAEMNLNRRVQEAERKLVASNKRFEAKTPAQKRVAIAKDVLKWVGVGKLIPTARTYLRPASGHREGDRVNGNSCKACALGAVFACVVERKGGLHDFWNTEVENMREWLEPYFSIEQLRLIEAAFEISPDFANGVDGAHAAYQFGRNVNKTLKPDESVDPYECVPERMVAIMENIIANKGTFVP